MQIVTLTPKDLDEFALRLAKAVKKGTQGCFDAIVAVRKGGSFVCDAFCRFFPSARYATRFDVNLQRPSTKIKEWVIGRSLKRLPRRLLDAMRMAEATVLSISRKLKGIPPSPDVVLPEGLKSILVTESRPQILVIDDSIDSGDTLYAIVETLRKTNPHTAVCIAVITETTRNPRIRSNYAIYRNKTLIRFPWSNDYKKN